MTDRFKVGDRVRILKFRVGQLATVLGPRSISTDHEYEEWTGKACYPLEVDLAGMVGSRGNKIAYPQEYLAPMYDGWDKTEWKDCYWKPKILEKV